MNFKDKTVLITGASSGIGKALAYKLIGEECNLVLISRRIELLYEVSQGIKNSNVRILPIQCDVSKKEDVKAAFFLIQETFQNVDIAILNAGAGYRVTPHKYRSDYAELTFGANVFGLIYWIEQLLPDFLERKKGLIVGVTSLADNRGFSGSSFYCASKAAASTYLEGLRVELKKFGIKVITVKPGFVKTPMTDKNEFKMPLIMSPEKAANIIITGIKKEKRIIAFPWPTVLGIKLIGLLPDKIYEFLAVHFEN